MKIKGSTALVTGANRGLGLAYARALLAAGAAKVYAAARDPGSVKEPGLVPVRLDVTNAPEVEAAATACSDVNIIINNAGIIGDDDLLSSGGNAQLRRTLETNLFGVLSVSNAFAPVLKKNGGGALVNMLSALSWASMPGTGAYSVSKAAAWALTNGLRNELRGQSTLVVAVHAGYIDTDMVASVTAPKSKPEDIAQRVIEALLADQPEVLADETSRQVKAGFGMALPLYTQAR